MIEVFMHNFLVELGQLSEVTVNFDLTGAKSAETTQLLVADGVKSVLTHLHGHVGLLALG